MNKYVKLFFASSLSFGILWTLFMALYWHRTGYTYTLKEYLFIAMKTGFLFGFIMTFFLTVISFFSEKKNEKTNLAENTKTEKTIVVKVNYNEAFELSKKAITGLGAKVVTENNGKGIIVARTGFSWKSFGEDIKIVLTKLESQQIQVNVSSKPIVKTTIIDYGKNYENVCTIVKMLELL